MPPVMSPEAISSSQSRSALLPRGLRYDHLGRRAVGRPHDLEISADPLADGAGELDLRALEAQGADDGRVLAQSNAIIRYLARESELLPAEAPTMPSVGDLGRQPAQSAKGRRERLRADRLATR